VFLQRVRLVYFSWTLLRVRTNERNRTAAFWRDSVRAPRLFRRKQEEKRGILMRTENTLSVLFDEFTCWSVSHAAGGTGGMENILIRADVAATRSRARRETVISDASTATPVETVYPRGHGKIDDPLRAVTIGPPRAGTPIISLRAPAPSYPSHVLTVPDLLGHTPENDRRERPGPLATCACSRILPLSLSLSVCLSVCVRTTSRYNRVTAGRRRSAGRSFPGNVIGRR